MLLLGTNKSLFSREKKHNEQKDGKHGRLVEISRGREASKAKVFRGKSEAKLEFPEWWWWGGGGGGEEGG